MVGLAALGPPYKSKLSHGPSHRTPSTRATGRVAVRTVGAARGTRAACRRIVVFGSKGGVGATTIALNLAVTLAQQGERCLLCDAAGGDIVLQLPP